MTIYEKIAAIMKDVKYLQKDDSVEFKTTRYKALSEEKVTSIMREKLIEHGLVVWPTYQTATRDGNITHVDVVYRMVNVENPEEFIEIASAGDGADTQDKGTGKAMTYAYKYMWLRTFGIPTGEDPDKVSSDELDYKQAQDAMAGLVTDIEAKTLMDLVALTGTDLAAMLNYYKVDHVSKLTKKQYAEAVKRLERKETK